MLAHWVAMTSELDCGYTNMGNAVEPMATSTDKARPESKGAEPTTLHEKTEERLRKYLTGGRMSTGDKLPPEIELCKTLDVSRNTLRLALGRLERDGYLLRRKRLGTVVIRTAQPNRFTVDLSSIETIRDYLRRTDLTDRVVGKRKIPAAIQKAFGFNIPEQWMLVSGVRREIGAEKIIAGVDLYVDPGYATDAVGLDKGNTSQFLYEVIQKRHGEAIWRIDMNVLPLALPGRWAASFGEPEGTPTLGLIDVVRKADGSPIEVFSTVFAPSVRISAAFVPKRHP